jgi:hypothetical protein
MDIKFNFYYACNIPTTPLLDDVHSYRVITRTTKCPNFHTNTYSSNVLSLVNSSDMKINYQFLQGWECAKVLLPKVCIDHNYVTKILLALMDNGFLEGFDHYKNSDDKFKKFQIEYSVVTIKYRPKERQNLKIYEYSKYKDYMKNYYKTKFDTFDGVVSCNYLGLFNLHPKGYYLSLVPRNKVELYTIYNSFLFKSCVLIDVPILSSAFILGRSIKHNSRLCYDIPLYVPYSSQTNYFEEQVEVSNALELDKMKKIIAARQEQLAKYDYASEWFSSNENFINLDSSLEILTITDRDTKVNQNDDDSKNESDDES